MPGDVNTQSETEASWGGKILGIIIVLAFIVATMFMVPWALKPIGQSMKANSWEKTSAIITSLHVDARANQYMVKAEYSYSFQGETYSSNRVFFDDMVGVRKEYYRNIYWQLAKHRTATNPLNIWINPSQPQQAVIFKGLKWDKFIFRLFCTLVFALIGFGPIYVWVSDYRDQRP